MLRDITIGQFYPVKSKIHNLDPRVKIVGTLLYLISLFTFRNFFGYLIVTAFLGTVIFLSHVPFRFIVRGLKAILFLLIFTAVFNIFWTPGIVVFQWGFLRITRQGLQNGFFMALRLIYLILGSSILTYTTTPNQLTDAIESLLKPLKKIKVPVHDFAMMMTIALRFIPTLIEETDKIMNAQRARGVDFSHGNLIERGKALIPVLIPLFLSAIRRAGDLATAMECRCYHGGKGRTRMNTSRLRDADFAMLAVFVIFCAVTVFAGNYFPIYCVSGL